MYEIRQIKRKFKQKVKDAWKFVWKFINPFRILILFLVCSLLIAAIVLGYMMTGEAPVAEKIDFGITFSQLFAEQLNLNWRQAYSEILDDLNVKKIRLIAYWSEVEPNKDEYFFEDLDWQIEEASRRGAEIILVMGQKVPRWPECHIPGWAQNLSESDRQAELLALIDKIIRRYQGEKAIKYWQVENEPFLRGFGECPSLDKKFLDKEIALIKGIDSRPIILTTSGELSLWSEPAMKTSILGTTLYRVVWGPTLGSFHYPITPVFYYKRAKLVKWLFNLDKVFVVELQAEPWKPKQIYETPLNVQYTSMNLKEFEKTIEYVRRTGFDEVYLWGAEWWYWLKEYEYDSDIWTEARKLWQ